MPPAAPFTVTVLVEAAPFTFTLKAKLSEAVLPFKNVPPSRLCVLLAKPVPPPRTLVVPRPRLVASTAFWAPLRLTLTEELVALLPPPMKTLRF